MNAMNRREFLAGSAAAAATLAAHPALAQQPKRGGTLRFIPHADLKVLDPIVTTAYITRNHGYMIYDTLFGTDASFQVKPQMVDRWNASGDRMKWTFTLRDGLKWHDGQPVTAEDCVASVKRWWQRDTFGQQLARAAARIEATDRKTLVLELKSPFAQVVEALGKPSSNVPFMMPRRVAETPASQPIQETIGSGPYKFVKGEWQPGNQVGYERNGDYAPRDEAPSGTTGGKRVHVDRVVWRYIPDAATAAAAIEAGEVDYWEIPPLDFVPRLESRPNLAVFLSDPRGYQGWLRPNHLHPPFDNKKARQALASMVDQNLYLQAAIGQPKYYKTCPAMFMCGMPFETAAGAPQKPDLERARALLKESGYDGRPIVILDATDVAVVHAASLVTGELLRQIGATVDMQAMDWSTLVARRAKKEPPNQGGWNILHTWWISGDLFNPAVHAGVSGGGDAAWFGWPKNAEIEQARVAWVQESDPSRRKQIAEQIQSLAYDEVTYIPWGQYLQPAIHRKTVKGVLQNPATILWNVWLDT
jgi:peptide/nickel transport system substrate-binding protein